MTADELRQSLTPYIRHRATCALQAVRDNAPDDELCTCGLRDVWLASGAPDPWQPRPGEHVAYEAD